MQFTKLIWRDGQPYSELFDDIYYSSEEDEGVSGESEFKHVFFDNNGLPERWAERENFVIAELGFGSGLNCVLTIREWLQHCDESEQQKTLHYIAIEKYPLSANDIATLLSRYPKLKPVYQVLLENYPPAIKETHCRVLFDGRVVIHFKFMDVDDALADEGMAVDAWYLDGFAPAKNPAMWSELMFTRLAENSSKDATCSTYTAAGFVRRNLQQAGFHVDKVPGFGRKREMLVARRSCDEVTGEHDAPFSFRDKPWFERPAKIGSGERTATILGAGIAGLSLAYALVMRGWSVTIIDRHGDIAKETSSNPAPIVYPRLSVNNDVDMSYYVSAYCYALHMFAVLQKNSKQKFWYGDGLLQQIDEERLVRLLEKYQFNDDFIAKVGDVSDGQQMIEYVSAGVVLPEILCRVIRDVCAGSLTIIKAEVEKISYTGDRWRCICKVDENNADANHAGANHVIEDKILMIANGAGIDELGLPIDLTVEKIRGQVAVLDANDATSQIQKTRNADIHITPAIDGRHYLGATYSRGCDDPAVSQKDSLDLLTSLQAIYPGLFDKDDLCDAWVGFRTVSKDRVPIVGALPDVSFYQREYSDIRHGKINRSYPSADHLRGLYISAAHGSRGFTSSFLSAEIIVSLIEGSPLPVSKKVLDHINPSRFVVNDLKRR